MRVELCHLLRPVIGVRQAAAEAAFTARIHPSVRLLLRVRVPEDRGGVRHFPPDPPADTGSGREMKPVLTPSVERFVDAVSR